jgi:hypothetical protein
MTRISIPCLLLLLLPLAAIKHLLLQLLYSRLAQLELTQGLPRESFANWVGTGAPDDPKMAFAASVALIAVPSSFLSCSHE